MWKPRSSAARGHLQRLGEAVEDAAHGAAAPRRAASPACRSLALRVCTTSGSPVRARGADVDAEALALPGHVGHAAAVQAVVVEPGFADRHHARQARQRQQVVERRAPARLRCRGARPPCTRSCRAPAPAHARASNSSSVVQMHSARSTLAAAIVARSSAQAVVQFGKAQVAVGVDEHAARRGRPARGAGAGRSDRLRRLGRRDAWCPASPRS